TRGRGPCRRGDSPNPRRLGPRAQSPAQGLRLDRAGGAPLRGPAHRSGRRRCRPEMGRSGERPSHHPLPPVPAGRAADRDTHDQRTPPAAHLDVEAPLPDCEVPPRVENERSRPPLRLQPRAHRIRGPHRPGPVLARRTLPAGRGSLRAEPEGGRQPLESRAQVVLPAHSPPRSAVPDISEPSVLALPRACGRARSGGPRCPPPLGLATPPPPT